ncbi:MAG TPA: sigma-54 dependent transcriptional regulator [Rhodocyclaceae bacterium]|nr:sigma-54 dependent transcriptional regulator [Rhodocyclaceae bacterium]
MEELSRFNLVGKSPIFGETVNRIHRMAQLDATVLIAGETGTGKELAARAIHYLGGRTDKPFVPVNCGALSESLVESELFGHERGAFTDAKTASLGLIGEASGGTLFLDEVDTLTLKAQAALLRFLQDRTYRRVGGGGMRHVDVRIIVASNADLAALSLERRFRQDLLYRLNVLTLTMPALRERGDDAVLIAQSLLQRLNHQYRVTFKSLHPDAIAFIRRYAWRGNVRELENVIHREFLMDEESVLQLRDSRRELEGEDSAEHMPAAKKSETALAFREAKARAVAKFEQNYVAELLNLADGNISYAARLASQDRSAFGKLVRKYGLGTDNSLSL